MEGRASVCSSVTQARTRSSVSESVMSNTRSACKHRLWLNAQRTASAMTDDMDMERHVGPYGISVSVV